jgi:hypothetical protein
MTLAEVKALRGAIAKVERRLAGIKGRAGQRVMPARRGRPPKAAAPAEEAPQKKRGGPLKATTAEEAPPRRRRRPAKKAAPAKKVAACKHRGCKEPGIIKGYCRRHWMLQVRAKKSRVGRNPQTGEEIEITARRVLTFKPSQVLKEATNGLTSRSRLGRVEE